MGGASGAYVYDVEANSKRLLYSDSGSNSRILASNSKLFTTAAYLDRFGGSGRLKTRVFERGKRTGGRERTLKGSLVLLGDGDPALAVSGFAASRNLPLTSVGPLAKAVKDAGIRNVKGKIVADPTIFDGAGSVPMPGVRPGSRRPPHALGTLVQPRDRRRRRLRVEPGAQRRRRAQARAPRARRPGEREA